MMNVLEMENQSANSHEKDESPEEIPVPAADDDF